MTKQLVEHNLTKVLLVRRSLKDVDGNLRKVNLHKEVKNVCMLIPYNCIL